MSDYSVTVEGCVDINVTVVPENIQTVVVREPQAPTIITVATVQQGPPGTSYQETFETVSKNLRSWGYVLNYSSGVLTSIVYSLGPLTITKTLNYQSGLLTSIVLSGDTPGGISLTKTLTYSSGVLTSISYS